MFPSAESGEAFPDRPSHLEGEQSAAHRAPRPTRHDGLPRTEGACTVERLESWRERLRAQVLADPPNDDSESLLSGADGIAGDPRDVLAVGRAFAERLGALATDACDPDDLSSLVIALDGVMGRIHAVHREFLGKWDESGAWSADGARTGAGWLAGRCELSRRTATQHLKCAATLRRFPATAAAARGGDIGTDKVRLLTGTARSHSDAYLRDEAWIIDQAAKLTVAHLAKFLAHWELHIDPNGHDDREARAHERRALHLSRQFNGTWKLDGTFEAEAGELLANAITASADTLLANERRLIDSDGFDALSSPPQRRADALIDLVTRGMGADPESSRPPTALITAFIDAHRLTQTHPDAPDISEHIPRARTDVGETAAGMPLTRDAALRLACDAGIARVITNGTSTPVDLGSTERCPSPAQRRALTARDRHCTFPGCDRPPANCHAHHIVHWANDGPTNMANLALVCSRHHHLIHEGGFQLTRGPDDHLHFARPDGTPITLPTHDPPPNPIW